jgi:hypothetical protein
VRAVGEGVRLGGAWRRGREGPIAVARCARHCGGDPAGARLGRGGWRQRHSIVQGGGRGGVRWDLVAARKGEIGGPWAGPGKEKNRPGLKE